MTGRDASTPAHVERQVALQALTDIDALAQLWLDLEARAPHSFFQSWAWIGCWLRALPRELHPLLFSASVAGRPAALAILVPRRDRRHGLFLSRSLHLNETGVPALDTLTIEYNGFLFDPSSGFSQRDIVEYLRNHCRDWDELVLGGLRAHELAALHCDGLVLAPYHTTRAYFVNLNAVRASGGDFLNTLSANSRYQLRRARALYAARGSLRLDTAHDEAEAQAFLTGLKALHQAYWTIRGAPGAFAAPFFEIFHRALIASRFASGEIQLLRVMVGADPIGYLYNFVHRGHVYAYQSGFAYEADNKIKPGLVAHSLAIEMNLRAGRTVYDFMAGEDRHKQSLSNDGVDLAWVRLQRPHAKFMVERTLKQMKRLLSLKWSAPFLTSAPIS